MKELAIFLSKIDELETWNNHVKNYSKPDKSLVFKMAQPLWVKRMVIEQKLYLNPRIIEQLKNQQWEPTDIQKRMIWASLLASDESSGSKDRMYRIKKILIKKYNKSWWEDVYLRIKPAYAAKERIKKIYSGSAVTTLINNTFLFAQAAHD